MVITYCIDTSALIEAWQIDYPVENFPGFWKRMDELIAAERLVAPEEVLRETKKRSDELYAWLNARKHMLGPRENLWVRRGSERQPARAP